MRGRGRQRRGGGGAEGGGCFARRSSARHTMCSPMREWLLRSPLAIVWVVRGLVVVLLVGGDG